MLRAKTLPTKFRILKALMEEFKSGLEHLNELKNKDEEIEMFKRRGNSLSLSLSNLMSDFSSYKFTNKSEKVETRNVKRELMDLNNTNIDKLNSIKISWHNEKIKKHQHKK